MSTEQEFKDAVEKGTKPNILDLEALEAQYVAELRSLRKNREVILERQRRIGDILALVEKRMESTRSALKALQQ